MLQREIEGIKTLLEAEPDAKCKLFPAIGPAKVTEYRHSGPLESLVHYSSLLLPTLDQQEATSVIAVMQAWLYKLQSIDPYRKARYAELAEGLSPAS